MSAETISIHYRRLPDRDGVFRQLMVEDAGEYVVTLLKATPLSAPVMVAERVVLDPDAPVVWFTYPKRWYDLGRFHRSDGTFTGFYANVFTPVRMQVPAWDTTDLCLDVWLGADGHIEVLDTAEFEDAIRHGWIDSATGATAREQANALAAGARSGKWPPAHAHEWDLARVQAHLKIRPGSGRT